MSMSSPSSPTLDRDDSIVLSSSRMRSNARASAWEPAGRGPPASMSRASFSARPSEKTVGGASCVEAGRGAFSVRVQDSGEREGGGAGRTSATGVGRRLSRYHPEEHAKMMSAHAMSTRLVSFMARAIVDRTPSGLTSFGAGCKLLNVAS